MSNIATANPSTLEALSEEFSRLKARVEDLEDLRDLNEAIARNADKPLSRLEDLKSELGLD